MDATIAGKHVCLIRGQRCFKRFDRQYHRYGFHCHSGRLTGESTSPKPKPVPPAGKIVATIPVPSIGGIAVGGGALWVANLLPGTVTRVDPQTNAVAATIEIGDPEVNPGFGPTRVAFAHGSVWVADGASSSVYRIDPETNRIVASIPLGEPTQVTTAPLGLAVTPDAVWVANRWGKEDAFDGSVVRIDPQTNRIVASIPLGASPTDSGPTSITANSAAVWVGVPSMKSIVRIDPATNSVVATVPELPCSDGGLATDESDASVWSADYCTSAVHRIDAGANAIAKTIPIAGSTGSGVNGIAIGLGSLWVRGGPLYRIDRSSGTITGVLPLPPAWNDCEYSIAFGFGSVWVRHSEQVFRIQP